MEISDVKELRGILVGRDVHVDLVDLAEAIEAYAKSHVHWSILWWSEEYEGLDREDTFFKLKTSHDLYIEIEKFEEEFGVRVDDVLYVALEDAFYNEVVRLLFS